jgi:hypothetical protein
MSEAYTTKACFGAAGRDSASAGGATELCDASSNRDDSDQVLQLPVRYTRRARQTGSQGPSRRIYLTTWSMRARY